MECNQLITLHFIFNSCFVYNPQNEIFATFKTLRSGNDTL